MSAVWLSYAPRVLLQHDFLTQKECAFLIKLAKEQGLQRARWFAQRFIFEQPLPASVAAHGPMYRSPYEPAMRTADRRPGCMADARSDPPTACASAAMQRECAQSCEVALQEWRAQSRDEL